MIFVYLLKSFLQAEYNFTQAEIHQIDDFSLSNNRLKQHSSRILENPCQISKKPRFPVNLDIMPRLDMIVEVPIEDESIQQALIVQEKPKIPLTSSFYERFKAKREHFNQTTTYWYNMILIGLLILAGLCVLLLLVYVLIYFV